MTYKTVGESTLDLLDNSIDIIYTYDPTNGNTQTKRKFRSDDITDSNRSVFDNLITTRIWGLVQELMLLVV